MRQEITTIEISEKFRKVHRDILRSMRKFDCDEISMSLFTEYKYKSLQNKELPAYRMGVDGFCLLTDTWGFSRGESAKVKASILSEFGYDFVIAFSSRTRHEDSFSSMLNEFLSDDKIIREFPIAGKRIDFYIPEYSLAIEYDEEQHFSKDSKERDCERWSVIQSYVISELEDPMSLIRVKKGEEIKGLSNIAAWIASNTNNATGITKYIQG
jgi:very-short-patch-repair endonuclease